MRTALVASKWFDICNGLECVEHFELEQPTVILIGSGRRQQEVLDYCLKEGLEVIQLLDPDLYSWYVAPKLNSALLKGFLFPFIFAITYAYWHVAWFCNQRLMRDKRFPTVIFDMWRTKCAVLPDLRPDRVFVIDGGYSTLALGLLDSWTKGNLQETVKTYLDNQAKHQVARRGEQPLGLRLTRSLYSRAFYTLPRRIRSRLKKAIVKLSDDPILFSSYSESNRSSGKVHNAYNRSKALMGSKPVGAWVLIIGHPEFRTLAESIEELAKVGTSVDGNILYLFHPRDRELMRKSSEIERLFEDRIEALGFRVCTSGLTLEHFLLRESQLPSAIVLYPSSSLKWLERVLPEDTSLLRVKISNSPQILNANP